MVLLFWLLLFLVFYTFLGYGLLMALFARILRYWDREQKPAQEKFEPPVTLVVAAYNERSVVEQKVANSRALDYPDDKLHLLFVTDGSDDGTGSLLAAYPKVRVLHQEERQGKTAAVNRAMQVVDTPIAIFSDANSMLNTGAIRALVNHFTVPEVGCVAGEKRVLASGDEASTVMGEGLYWRYESAVKRWESTAGNVMGAAGELYAVRSALYSPLPTDTLLDDFVTSFQIAMRGHCLAYAPDAYAMEQASTSVREEWKRKVRNCAGGLQAVTRLAPLLNPVRYGFLSFQYISHRVLRWTVTPVALALLLPLNLYLAWAQGGLYILLCWLQVIFYAAAGVGWQLERRQTHLTPFYVPYYFVMMNLAVFAGMLRFARGEQSVLWDKVQRTEQ